MRARTVGERERESGAGSGSSGAWDGTSGVFMPCLIKGGDVENTTTQKVAACVVRDFVFFEHEKLRGVKSHGMRQRPPRE